jgi:protein-S-isoprenylcysteine O-methyltransferase Ste14
VDTSYHALLPVTWLCWALYWGLAAIGTKATTRRESAASRLVYTVPIALGALALFASHPLAGMLRRRFVPATAAWFWVGWAVTLAGLALAVAARMWLGRNWSGTVTLKKDHELIRTGPYAYVRHPIYTGLLLALIGTAIAIGQWQALVGVALVALALVRKMTVEERFMRDQFGEAYARYRARVRALVPFVV